MCTQRVAEKGAQGFAMIAPTELPVASFLGARIKKSVMPTHQTHRCTFHQDDGHFDLNCKQQTTTKVGAVREEGRDRGKDRTHTRHRIRKREKEKQKENKRTG